jgi:O-antigen ligase
MRKNGLLGYLGLIIVFIAAYTFSTVKDLSILFHSILFTSLCMTLYGLAQIAGRDPIDWVNPYNSMIGTLGNPNFASATLAIFSVTLGFGLVANIFSNKLKVVVILTILLAVYCVIQSQSRQGLLVIVFSILFYLVLFVNLNYKKFRFIVSTLGAVFFMLFVFGMLNSGPLSQYLYKDSVSIRGYYWRAGIEMFKQNWIFGVGLDRYGAYFKEFKEPGYGLKYGFEITSNNAHNIPIQLFATGGVFVGIFYLALIALVLYKSINLLKAVTGSEQKTVMALLSGFIGYLAQTVISIDNIGVSVWGWLLAGSLLALTKPHANLPKSKTQFTTKSRRVDINVFQPAVSFFITCLMSFICFNIYQAESNVYKLRGAASALPDNKIFVKTFANKILKNNFADPPYQFEAAEALIRAGYLQEGNDALGKLFKREPQNLTYLRLYAFNEEKLGNFKIAINLRNKISKLDPWNAQNYLDLMNLYIKDNDIKKASEIKDRLMGFAKGTEYATKAADLLRNS